ncbi:MAG: hypothetical protein ACREXX_18450 [Gammaproteobacteria bacterium]
MRLLVSPHDIEVRLGGNGIEELAGAAPGRAGGAGGVELDMPFASSLAPQPTVLDELFLFLVLVSLDGLEDADRLDVLAGMGLPAPGADGIRRGDEVIEAL